MLYIFLATPDEVENYVKVMQSSYSDNCVHRFNVKVFNLFDPEMQLIKTKPTIKNKLKEILSQWKKFKFQSMLVLEYKKRNCSKIFH